MHHSDKNAGAWITKRHLRAREKVSLLRYPEEVPSRGRMLSQTPINRWERRWP